MGQQCDDMLRLGQTIQTDFFTVSFLVVQRNEAQVDSRNKQFEL